MKRAAYALVALACLLVMGEPVLAARGYLVNVTPSVPFGLYQRAPVHPSVGDYVAVCPPAAEVFVQARRSGYLPSGNCPGDFRVLLKVLAGTEGDRVQVGPDGVFINGEHWPNSRPARLDGCGRALAQLTMDRRLRDGEVFVMSEALDEGWDGRYFGALPRASIVGPVQLLLRW